jgi:hypothetical protein
MLELPLTSPLESRITRAITHVGISCIYPLQSSMNILKWMKIFNASATYNALFILRIQSLNTGPPCSPSPERKKGVSISVVNRMSIPFSNAEAILSCCEERVAVVHQAVAIFVGQLSLMMVKLTPKTGNTPCPPLNTTAFSSILTETTPQSHRRPSASTPCAQQAPPG